MESGFYKKKKMLIPLICEFTGAALLVGGFEMADYIALSLAYFISWVLFGAISGCHLNPIFSLAVFFMEKKYKDKEMIIYLLLEMLV